MTEDEQKIREMVEQWMAASMAGDVSALLALMTDDVIFMTPGAAPFGKQAFAAAAQGMKDVRTTGRCEIQEIEVFCDRAYIRNHIQLSLSKADGPPLRMSGYTLGILRKGADGRWRLCRDANLVGPGP
jgi:uncharacterized protein (TIGR02246 family)